MQIDGWIWAVVLGAGAGLLLFAWFRYRATPPGLVVLQQENQALHTQLQALSAVQGQYQQLQQHVSTLEQQQQQAQADYQHLQQQWHQLALEKAQLVTTMEEKDKQFSEKLAWLEQAKGQMTSAFEQLSQQVLEQTQQQLDKQSVKKLDQVLKPMQGTLQQFQTRMERVHKETLEGRASLKTQLNQLQSLNQHIGHQAEQLSTALKGDQKLQGHWGEMILTRLLALTGLREGQDFEVEKQYQQADGQRLRPDVVVHLPDHKHVIIDAKVSLKDYEQAFNAQDEAQKTQALRAHLKSLKSHVQSLAHKRYDHIEQLHAPDFVLMFVPIEGAYIWAVEQDTGLFEQAFEKKIAIVTPTTLFTTLKTIEQLWRYERQSAHTSQLVHRAAEVHDKFVSFADNFEKIGRQLGQLESTYAQTRKQMLSGSGNVIRQAEMLKDLAGKTKKELPSHLLEQAEGAPILNATDHHP